jgi:hypothetical protein
MLNTNNSFKFCIPKHGLHILLYGRHCTDHTDQVIKAAVQ